MVRGQEVAALRGYNSTRTPPQGGRHRWPTTRGRFVTGSTILRSHETSIGSGITTMRVERLRRCAGAVPPPLLPTVAGSDDPPPAAGSPLAAPFCHATTLLYVAGLPPRVGERLRRRASAAQPPLSPTVAGAASPPPAVCLALSSPSSSPINEGRYGREGLVSEERELTLLGHEGEFASSPAAKALFQPPVDSASSPHTRWSGDTRKVAGLESAAPLRRASAFSQMVSLVNPARRISRTVEPTGEFAAVSPWKLPVISL
jgi:hypothetical protein